MPNHIHGIIGIVGVPLVGTRKTVGDLPKRADTRQLEPEICDHGYSDRQIIQIRSFTSED